MFGLLRMTVLILLLAFSAENASWAQPARSNSDVQNVLREIDRDIQRFYAGERDMADRLERNVLLLSEMIDNQLLNSSDVAVARYIRGDANHTLNAIAEALRRPTSRKLALAALEDFDHLLQLDGGVGIGASERADIEYKAGSSATKFLSDRELGYRYWRQCASRDHAGCMNNMANAMLNGDEGQAQDLPGAFALHKRIANTGINYMCAGAFSSLNVAEMAYFLKLGGSEDSPLLWIRKAVDLAGQVAERHQGNDICGRSILNLYEYLFGLAAGVKDEVPLLAILRRKEHPLYRAIAEYLLGRKSESEFAALLLPGDEVEWKCIPYGVAATQAAILGNRATLDSYRGKIANIKSSSCNSYTVYLAHQ